MEVVQLTAIRIRAPITRMKTGTLMPVYVMGLTSSQTPFSFGNALPGLTFHWSVTKRDILDVHTRHAEASVQLGAEHNFAMSVFGRSKGRTGLRVVVKSSVPLAGHLQDSALELQDEIQIQVYEKLQLLNPEVQVEEILMSPNSLVKLQTNRDGLGSLSYRVLDCPNRAALVQVDEKGHLTSGSLTGTASLQISSQETFGVNQTIIIAVKVVTVSYLRLSTSPVIYTSNREAVSAIPLGAVLTFSVHFHDSTGETLHSHNSVLSFSTNRDDLVQVGKGSSNGTLTVRTLNVGLTLLGVWDSEQAGLVDFLALPVQHAIHPAEAQRLVVGDVVCFSAQFVNQEGVSGVWSSSSSALLEIDPRTGAAVARDRGTVTVYYEILGQLRTYREVVIEGASQTSVMIPAVKKDRHPKVLMSTRSTGSNLIGSCSSSQSDSMALLHPESSVSCQLRFTSSAVDFSPHDVYHTHTAFDASSGFYSCALSFKPMSEQQVKVLSVSLTELEVRAGVQGSLFSGEQLSVRLPVSPGIYSDQTDIILSHQHPSAELTVYGPPATLQQLHVKSSSPAIVIEEKDVSHSFPSFVRYTVRAVKPQGALSASVSVSSASTAQVLHIPVSVMHLAASSSSVQAHVVDGADGPGILQQFIDSYQVMFFTLFALLAATAVVIIVCHALFSPRDPVNHPAFIQKTPAPAGVAKLTESPFNSSMSSSMKRSPRLHLYSPDYNSR